MNYIDEIVHVAVIIMAVWGFYKIIMEIVSVVTTRHDREQKWDEYDKAIADLNVKIDENQTDTDAKMQEIRSELFILTECMRGVLDGLHQLNCNGKVTEASEKLDMYLNKRAHT